MKDEYFTEDIIEKQDNQIADDFDDHGIEGEPGDENQEDNLFHREGGYAAPEEKQHLEKEAIPAGDGFGEDPDAVGEERDENGKDPGQDVGDQFSHAEWVAEEIEADPADDGRDRAEEKIEESLPVLSVKRIQASEQRKREDTIKNIAAFRRRNIHCL